MKRSRFLGASIALFLALGVVVAATGTSVPTLAEFNALEKIVQEHEDRISALEAEPSASPSPSSTPSSTPSASPSASPTAGFDRVVTGDTAGFTVPAGQTWKIQGLVTATGNVIVHGTLVMRPGDTLRFVGINEANYVGGGMDPVASDVGLWVMGAGKLDVQGTPKLAWNRTGTDPSWRSTDELVLTPTAAGEWRPEHFRPFTMGSPVPTAFGMPAEVLNLSRDVSIEGTPGGRAHVFIRSTSPQTIKHATLRWLGPRHPWGDEVLGRWPLHWHMAGNGSRGSIVEGVVCRDAGSHCFVPHASHGVTFRGTIAYDVAETPYWIDQDVAADDAHDTLLDSTVAALVRFPGDNVRNTAYLIWRGAGNVARGNVAVGVQTGSSSSGFAWEQSGSGLWVFEDNVAHNNRGSGIFAWHNNGTPHLISRFVAYRNGEYGIEHGAYVNSFIYRDSVLRDNAFGALALHALSRSDNRLTFRGIDFGGRIFSLKHNLPGSTPVLFVDCSGMTGVRIDDRDVAPSTLDFVRCNLEPSNFQIIHLQPGARIRVQRADGTAYEITPSGVRTTPAFA